MSILKQIIRKECIRLLEGRIEKNWIAGQNISEKERDEWLSAEKQGLKVSHLSWIKKTRGTEPIEDIVPDVVDFLSTRVQQIAKEGGYSTNLSTKEYPTTNSLRRLLRNISQTDQYSNGEYDISDRSQVQNIGKVGNWDIFFPLTQRGSIACDISGQDTTWCTQRRSGQNLFYSYVGRSKGDIILFYVMDYSRSPDDPHEPRKTAGEANNDSRLSIGFKGGEPLLDGQVGSLSVDAANIGLTDSDLRRIFEDKYQEIMSILQSKAEEIGTNHPAKKVLTSASQNLLLLKKMTIDLKHDEKEDFYKQVLTRENIQDDVVLHILANSGGSMKMKTEVASSTNISLSIISMLAEDDSAFVRKEIASNSKSNIEILTKLASDPDELVRSEVAKREGLSLETYIALAQDNDLDVRLNVAGNSSTPSELLYAISTQDPSWLVKSIAESNPNFSNLQEKKIKISKNLLRQIIKEEIDFLLNK